MSASDPLRTFAHGATLRSNKGSAAMPDANAVVMRRAVILWIGAGLLLGFNIFAASQQSLSLVHWALALSAAFAVFGIGFGVWAAKKVAERPK
jgi:Na+-transporting NADH:ubiquinone oxidoreductase subunit NqrD